MYHPVCPRVQAFVLFNVYFPSSGSGADDRLAFKQAFNTAFELRVRILLSSGRDVIVVGDVNIAHRAIDHCNPAEWVREMGQAFDKSPFRQWLSRLLGTGDTASGSEAAEPGILTDVFRMHHPDQQKVFTCWNSVTSARLTNYGTRIDYVLACKALAPLCTDCHAMPEIQGMQLDIALFEH